MKKVVEKVLGFLIALIFWAAVLTVGQNALANEQADFVYLSNTWELDSTLIGWTSASSSAAYRDILIPETCGNPFLLAYVGTWDKNENTFISFDNNELDLLLPYSGNQGNNSERGYFVSYTIPENVGNYEIYIERFGGNLDFPTIINLFCNVDPDDFLLYNMEQSHFKPYNTTNFSTLNISDENLMVFGVNGFPISWGASNYNHNLTGSAESSVDWNSYIAIHLEYGKNQSFTPTFYGVQNSYLYASFITLKYKKAEITPKAGILLFGSPYIWKNEIEFNYNQEKNYNIYFNTCSVYDTFDRAIIKPVYSSGNLSSGKEIIKSKSNFTGPQLCKDSINFIDQYNTDQIGDVYFDLILFDASNNIISKVQSNIMSFTTKERPDNFIDHFYNEPVIIDLGRLALYEDYTASTTRLYFTYDFTGQNPASTTVKLWDHRNATSTGYTTSGPFSSTSTSVHYIDIPTPTEATNEIYRFVAERPDYPDLVSKYFTINWSFYPQLDDILKQKICVEEVFDYSKICDGINTETTIGDWVCGIKTAFIKGSVFLTYASCESLLKLNDSFEKFKTSFPFNIFFDLVGTFDRAIEEAEKENLDNSFDVPFIKKTATSSQFYMLPVVSSSSFSNLIGEENYNTYLLTIGFIWWIIIAVIIFLTVRK